MKHIHFTKSNGDEWIAVYLQNEKEFNVENLQKLISEAKGRYVKVILDSEGCRVYVNLIKDELMNERVVSEAKAWILRDLEDLIILQNK